MLWPAADAIVVIGLSILSGLAYHRLAYGDLSHLSDSAKVGAAVALFRWILQHPVSNIAARPRASIGYQFYLWNAAFLCLLAFGFLGKMSGMYSRGAVLLFYVSGFPLLIMWQGIWKYWIRQGLNSGRLALRRGVLLGTSAKVDEFRQKYRPSQAGLIVANTVILADEALKRSDAGNAALNEGLDRVIDTVRMSHLDDILILLPWSATHAVNACVDRLVTIPVSVQLGPEAVFDRFTHVNLSRLGPTTMLNLVGPPLTRVEVLSKRLFDLALAAGLLIAISPLLLLVAVLIKLNTPGPVFFQQWRHGFNQRPFRILKFRTMTVSEDGEVVTQAQKNDPRVTRIGRYLRRWNLDELPQLVNVVKGEMSLIGPRPHALTL